MSCLGALLSCLIAWQLCLCTFHCSICPPLRLQGVTSPLAGQIVFRSVLFGAFGQSKQYFAKDSEGNPRQLTYADFYKVQALLQAVHSFTPEGPSCSHPPAGQP